jgi:hypothetical protein
MVEQTRRLGLLVPIPSAQAELGGVSRPLIYQLVKQHHLVKVSIGRRSFITGESLTGYVDWLRSTASEDDSLGLPGKHRLGLRSTASDDDDDDQLSDAESEDENLIPAGDAAPDPSNAA